MRRHRQVANFTFCTPCLIKIVRYINIFLQLLAYSQLSASVSLLHSFQHENRLRSCRLRCGCCNRTNHSILHDSSNSRNCLQSWKQVRTLPISSYDLEGICRCDKPNTTKILTKSTALKLVRSDE
jgi:hypothetical protein